MLRQKVRQAVQLVHIISLTFLQLMCQPDLGMVTYVWTRGLKQVLPDFNVYVLPC